MFNLAAKAGLGDSENKVEEKSNQKENLILSFHNSVQSVVLLKNALKESKNDGKKKYLDKVLSAREATKRATMELVKQEDSLFETKAEKHLFALQLQNIANNAANIASIISMNNLILSSITKKAVAEILIDITDIAKEMNFQNAVNTEEIMKKIVDLRQLIYDQHDRSSYLLMEKIVDSLQIIVQSLEKANEF